tara:strand:+ start:1241 stop:1684 length:444 start_codon:yes stop_codon:yes gene_type:complete
MEYRNNTSGAVETQSAILAKYPNTSFPKPLTNDVIESLGYTTILEGTRPTLTPPYDSVKRDGIEQISSKWYTKYIKVTATGDTKTLIDKSAAEGERIKRNQKLAETDYLALSDGTLSNDMKTYRQALRDLPKASGWPHTHTWPTKPS